MSMQTCIFLIVIFKKYLVLMCWASHFDIIESRKANVGYCGIYYAKKILNFLCVEFRILVKMLNMNEVHIFPTSLPQTCRLVTTSLCLNTWLRENKKNLQILIIFL